MKDHSESDDEQQMEVLVLHCSCNFCWRCGYHEVH